MLKTEPRFHLDRSYKGPFVIKSHTSTNADIRLKDDAIGELLNVSCQRLSWCSPEMSQSIPWVRHAGKLRKRHQLHRKMRPGTGTTSDPKQSECSTSRGNDSGTSTSSEKPKVSRKGHSIWTPARYLWLNRPQVHSQKEEEDVRPQLEEGSRGKDMCAECAPD